MLNLVCGQGHGLMARPPETHRLSATIVAPKASPVSQCSISGLELNPRALTSALGQEAALHGGRGTGFRAHQAWVQGRRLVIHVP